MIRDIIDHSLPPLELTGHEELAEHTRANLPYDIARCHGMDEGRICPVRDRCRRYLALMLPADYISVSAYLCQSGEDLFYPVQIT